MKMFLVVTVLVSLSACVRARTPDGKLYSCLEHNRPVESHGGPVPLFQGKDGVSYSCLGPHYDGVEKINGQKETVELEGGKTAVAGR